MNEEKPSGAVLGGFCVMEVRACGYGCIRACAAVVARFVHMLASLLYPAESPLKERAGSKKEDRRKRRSWFIDQFGCKLAQLACILCAVFLHSLQRV